MKTVTLTIPDLDTESPQEACRMFLAALVSADWSDGLCFEVRDPEHGPQHVVLPVDDVEDALRGPAHG